MFRKKHISLSTGSLITFAISSANFIFGALTSIILARALGPEGRGIATLILMIPSILVMVGTLGIEVSNVYFTGNRSYTLKDIVSNSLSLSFVLGFLFILLFWAVHKIAPIQNFIRINRIIPFYLWFAILSLPFTLLFTFFRTILLGREKIIQMNGIGFLYVLFQLVFALIFVVAFKQRVLGVVLSFTLSSILAAWLSCMFVRKMAELKFGLNFNLLNKTIRYGGKAYLGNLAQFLNYRLDIFLVAYFLNPTAVGFYGVAVGLAEKLWMIPSSVGTVLFPRISSGNHVEANNITPKMSRHTLFIVGLISVVLFLFVKPLIMVLFGSEYLPAVKSFVILLPGVVALSVSKVLTSDLAGRGKPQFGMLGAFISLPLTIVLDILLIPKWGICGAAFASSVAYTAATLFVIVAFLKISGSSLFDTLIIKRNDFTENIFPRMRKIKSIFASN